MTTALRRVLSTAIVLASGCFDVHGVEDDAAAPPDAGSVDAGIVECEQPAELEPVTALRYGPHPSADTPPSLTIHRILTDAEEDQYVLAIEEAVVLRAAASILFVGPDGEVRRTVELDRPAEVLHALDIVPTDSGWLAVGIDPRAEMRERWFELWAARITRPSSPPVRQLLAREEYGAIDGIRALHRADNEVDLYALRAGFLTHQIITDGVLGEARTMAGPFAPETPDPSERLRITAAREGATTCAVVASEPSGAGWSLRIVADDVVESEMFAPRGIIAVPVPVPNGDRCSVAFYEPDVRFPTRGRVRLIGAEAGALGWGGTTPHGLALLPDARTIALAVANPDWPDRVDLHVIDIGDSTCRVGDGSLRFSASRTPYPFGSIMTAPTAGDGLLFLTGLEGAGVLSGARLRAP